MHRMATDQLDRYRHAVAGEQTGADLEQIIRDVQPPISHLTSDYRLSFRRTRINH